MRAVIFGCAGVDLEPRERAFFLDADPWGFILFARNVDDPDRLRRLTGDLRESVGREAPVFVDQEGGRVARLRGPRWAEWEDVRPTLARLAVAGEAAAEEALRLRYALIAAELRGVGLDGCCAPLLDVPVVGADPIIGDRALGDAPAVIATRGRAVREGLEAGGCRAVVKHAPGHGRAGVDSHRALPRVAAPLEALRASDFAPFAAHADAPLVMTAHVVFEAIDPDRPATLSPAAIRLIRRELGMDGLLMTDDLSMGALSGPLGERARGAFAAGCDVVLHCDGDAAAMAAVAAETPPLAGDALRRAEAARRPEAAALDLDVARARLAALGAGPLGETALA